MKTTLLLLGLSLLIPVANPLSFVAMFKPIIGNYFLKFSQVRVETLKLFRRICGGMENVCDVTFTENIRYQSVTMVLCS